MSHQPASKRASNTANDPANASAAAPDSALPEQLPDHAPASMLGPIMQAVHDAAAPGDDLLGPFAQALYQRVSQEEFQQHSVQEWAALAAGFRQFAASRKPGHAMLRVFNPRQTGDGWETPHTVVQIVNDDMPFLVDSVSMALADRGIGVHVLGHPVMRVQRDVAGNMLAVGEGEAESMMHIEIDRQSAHGMRQLQIAIEEVLATVRASVNDWQAARERMIAIADALPGWQTPFSQTGIDEAQAFLRWAADDHFTFLGYRHYLVRSENGADVLAAVPDSGLGILRGGDDAKTRPVSSLGATSVRQAGKLEPLILTKTNARSSVHRRGHMDYIGVLEFDQTGKPIAEHRFLGLYTSSAYNRRPWEIPIVRQRFEHVMAHSGLQRSGHSGKALKHILETLPRDELFQANADELYQLATGILGLQERPRSKLFIRKANFGRFWSVLVYLPRDRYNTEVRLRIEALLKDTLQADHVDATVQFGESPLAQLYVVVRPRADAAFEVDVPALQASLAAIMRNWQDDLREQLVRDFGEEAGLELAKRYGRALPAGYIEQVSPALAAEDVRRLAALREDAPLAVSLQRVRAGDGGLRLKLYRLQDDIPLSDALPMMENMGLRVIAEHPHRIELADTDADTGEVVYVQDFEVEIVRGEANVAQAAALFEEAFLRTWSGDAENDGFNRLILSAGLDWRQAAVLRAYGKYLQQVGVPFSQSYIEQVFARYPLIARLLVELFQARFDPAAEASTPAEAGERVERLRESLQGLAVGSETRIAAAESALAAAAAPRRQRYDGMRAALLRLLDEEVSSLDEDRILRSYMDCIQATLRTNYYIDYAGGKRKDGGPADYLSFKLDCARIAELPKPRPYREIWVCGPRVEGIHLRFGPVARGGLRWSDRREDFRTEVLGLVKAQMVKNTVIVPVGSKGGFFAKQLPDPAVDRDAWLAEGVACYKRFINGLLDITDNLIDGKVTPPANVVRHDGDDAYLVVAADKGTATFSDIANGIAQAHGFWLDDAFASGGSVGYDHKGMGITARGAWESVKRHFRALGRNSQREDFTCAGIGDMSGDVFGNGMLLSRHIRLVAAFDHRHIFLDPDPDAATSYAERERLFRLPRSSWDDYDKSLISEGGGVHPRSAKSIALTAQVKAVLGIDGDIDAMTPSELMAAILKAPVDLLWNGGIGTYVKGARESNANVGDRANNALRVNGEQLRCKVVGEGGNLGFTQLGRIEAALQGVLLNTDFIDNSAGVDTSDHEVNIKILLNQQVRAKTLTLADRNALLASMTDDVAALVLNDNYRQNQALSVMQRMSLTRLGSKAHFIRTLETQRLLDRQIEYLPSDAEIDERKARGVGLTRPELAVLLSYSKLVAYPQLLESDVPEDPYLSKELLRYFPAPLQQRYAEAMERHQLKREIIATAVTNSTINRMGATFLMRMAEDSGRAIGEIAKAYTITRETLQAREMWAQIDELDGKVAEEAQIDALLTIWQLQRSFTRWLLARPGAMPAITDAVARYQDGFAQVRTGGRILPDALRPAYEQKLQQWRERGMPESLAEPLAALPYLEASPDIIELAQERRLDVVEVARVYFRVGEALRSHWLGEQIEALMVDGRWHAVARGVLRDDLAAQLCELTRQVLAMPGDDADAKVQAWLRRDDPHLRFTLSMLDELAAQKTLDYPTVSVAVQRLAQLASRG